MNEDDLDAMIHDQILDDLQDKGFDVSSSSYACFKFVWDDGTEEEGEGIDAADALMSLGHKSSLFLKSVEVIVREVC